MTLDPHVFAQHLLSPIVLGFALGLIARLLGSDLSVPSAIRQYLLLFLLLAVGIKGGIGLHESRLPNLALLFFMAALAALATTLSAYACARLWLRDPRIQAGALAAHFGSVSAVTYIASQRFVRLAGDPSEPILVTVVVALEVPAIMLGLRLARCSERVPWARAVSVLTGRSSMLLIGGFAIGALAAGTGARRIDAMYYQLFDGMLLLFVLDLGLQAAQQLQQLRGRGVWRLLLFATVLPLAHGLLGVVLGRLAGLGSGGATVFGALCASASYIAAPDSLRATLAEADIGRCVTAALGITFPFNLMFGVPAYAAFAHWLG